MSDEDERQASSNSNLPHEINNRCLSAIKLQLQELTREKTKYNVEKLTHDTDFLQSEIGHLRLSINESNTKINAQTPIKRSLNARITILRSSCGLRYTNLELALQAKELYEKELEKPNKTDEYRRLAQREINAIVEALPQLEKQEEYKLQLKTAEDEQVAARNKRETLLESLNTKIRKQGEIKQLLMDSETRSPEIEAEIENLRLEREGILSSIGGEKQRRRSSAIQQIKPMDSPLRLFVSLEQDTLEYEKRHFNEQLKKLHLLLNYFHEKMSEHNLLSNDTPCTTPSSELTSPLYNPITPLEEQTILSSYIDQPDYEKNSSAKTTNEPTVTIAMKLPRNFAPLDLNSTTTNEIIHSPYYQKTTFEYKKELPSDIVDKYAGIGKKNKQQQQQQQQPFIGRKNKKNKKNFGVKHSSQMISLYNDVRTSSGSSDTLPSMPMYEYDLPPTIKALQLMKQSVESYLNDLSQRYQYDLSKPIDEEHDEILEDDDIRDSAVDTYSEASSLIEPTNPSKDVTSIIPQLPEARSSSSSDDKKTVVSSASPSSSHHSHSKQEQQPSSSTGPLTTVEELPSYLLPLTIQIAQIERQISDEGYRSVRNEKQQQQQQATGTNSPLLTRSKSYDCTEKVDKWLSSTTPPLSITDKNINTDFQANDIDNEEDNLVEASISVDDH